MPDWSYQTVFRPLLFRLPPSLARDLALGAMGRLSRLPFGSAVIKFFGHTHVDKQLRTSINGVTFPTSVGLGCGIDANVIAPKAIARLGVGFIEIGPLTIEPTGSDESVSRNIATEEIVLREGDLNPGVDQVSEKVRAAGNLHVPILTRLSRRAFQSTSPTDAQTIVDRMSGLSQVLSVPAPASSSDDSGPTVEQAIEICRHARDAGYKLILLAIPVDAATDEPGIRSLISSNVIDGLLIDGAAHVGDPARRMGRAAFDPARAAVRQWRIELPKSATIIVSGGIHEPAQALALKEAGADLLEIDSGFVFAGPGLAKRINDAMFSASCEETFAPELVPPRATSQAWFWAFLLGLSMTFGGLLALLIAATRVILHYDEVSSGMSLAELCGINDKLLSFMQHDRVTLAGTMLADGILYSALALCAIRRGKHWAITTIAASAFTGFFSFFLFLGFGYFDPFHAFVTAVLLQILLLMVHSNRSVRRPDRVIDLHNDSAWKRHQWGQLLFVIQGLAVITAGIVICCVGITSVFVQQDLDFMNTTAEFLQNANPRLVPLIAHDRASFGGMLLSCGLSVLLLTLWGFKRGERWLWNALMLAGTAAYGVTILVHWHVGYSSLFHMLPAYGGLGVVWLGGALSRAYLCERTELNNLVPSLRVGT